MSNKRIIALLEDQLRLSVQREKSLLEQLAQQSTQLHQQSIQIEELTASIRSLEEALLIKNGSIQALTGKNRGLGKLISNQSEKITVPAGSGQVKALEETVVPNLKERGNNNAKRKEFFDMETIIEEVYPDDPGFDKEKIQGDRLCGFHPLLPACCNCGTFTLCPWSGSLNTSLSMALK